MPDSPASTTALVRRLAAGDAAVEAPLRTRLTAPLAAIVTALRDDPDADGAPVREAITAAIAAVTDDPDGAASLHGGSWDGTGFAAFVLRRVMATIGRPTRLDSTRLDGLSLQARTMLLLVEIELLTTEDVAGLFGVAEDEIVEHEARMRQRLGLPQLPSSPCPSWGTVRAHHRLDDEDELEEASVHLTTCDPCAEAADGLDQRRGRLLQAVPGIGWTQLGQAYAARDVQR